MIGEEVFIGGVFLAGVLSFFSPCILPVLPLYFSYLSGGLEEKRRWVFQVKSLLFVFGIGTTFLLLGFGAGTIGQVVTSSWFLVLCGLIVVAFGLYQMGLFKIVAFQKEKRFFLHGKSKSSFLGAYVLGFSFSFGWTPCIGPILASVLAITAGGGSASYGLLLMMVYTLGLAIPFLVLSMFSQVVLSRLKGLYPYMEKITFASGVVLVIMGILLMTNQVGKIIAFFS